MCKGIFLGKNADITETFAYVTPTRRIFYYYPDNTRQSEK